MKFNKRGERLINLKKKTQNKAAQGLVQFLLSSSHILTFEAKVCILSCLLGFDDGFCLPWWVFDNTRFVRKCR